MFTIVEAKWLAPKVRFIRVSAPRIANSHKAGHFVIVRVHEGGERIPLTVADTDPAAGFIILIVQAVGATTEALCALETGETIKDIAGPLGKATEIEEYGHCVLVGGGVGTAVIYPQAKALAKSGNRVSAIIGGRSREYVILESELAAVCNSVHPCTDDGSYGFHGLVTVKLEEILKTEGADCVLTAGPVPMMRAVAEVTRRSGVKTIASLNPLMVDGTGMCGGCRVKVDGAYLFACVDGPEFDAHAVDFQELSSRLGTYKTFERQANEKAAGHVCSCAKRG